MNNDGEQVFQPTGRNTPQGAVQSIQRSIRPGSRVPATVLVADMGNGALLLTGWRSGPAAYLVAEDAAALHRALAAAFGPAPANERE